MDLRPVLKRFEIVVLKDKGGSPNPKEQVPAAAVVSFYRQGATVSATGLVEGDGGTGEISIYNRGALTPGDTVQVNLASSATTLLVDSHPGDPRKVLLKTSPFQIPVTLSQWDRLTPINSPPTPAHPTGAQTSPDSFINTSATDGRGSCYIAAYRWDYLVSVGSAVRLFIDAEGSFVIR